MLPLSLFPPTIPFYPENKRFFPYHASLSVTTVLMWNRKSGIETLSHLRILSRGTSEGRPWSRGGGESHWVEFFSGNRDVLAVWFNLWVLMFLRGKECLQTASVLGVKRERVNEWVGEWAKEWVSERAGEWMSVKANEWISGWVNEWKNGWVNKRVNELARKRMSELVSD
jgi:hypothetical protein